MSLRVWLILFILSMAASAEVLLWAIRHGQFRDVNRGNVMPLRPDAPTGRLRRPTPWGRWRLLAYTLGLAALTWVWASGIHAMLHLASSKP
ncbi:MAG: hypothetical protein ACRD01_09745 [Terriglobales bacterium]